MPNRDIDWIQVMLSVIMLTLLVLGAVGVR